MPYHSTGFIGMNSDDADFDMPLGDYRDALNLQTGKEGVSGNPTRANLKGTLQINASFPTTGINKILGEIEDKTRKQLIIFLYNSKGAHGIYALKNGVTTKIVEDSGFNFKASSRITNAGITGQYLGFVIDDEEPKKVDLLRTYQLEKFLDQYSFQPPFAPTILRIKDPNFSRFLISLKNLQFAYRFIYVDNQVSNFSPYSKIAKADITSDVEDTNAVEVFVQWHVIGIDPVNFVKYVEFLVREGDNEPWYKFYEHEVEDSNQIKATYYGNETLQAVSDEDSAILFDLIPKSSKALASIKNRLFYANTKHHYDVSGNYNLTVTESFDYPWEPSLKKFGIYSFAIAFYDEKMRSSGALREKELIVSGVNIDESNGFSGIKRSTPLFSFSGKAPSWAKYWKILMADEQSYEIYEQFPVNVWFYVSDNKVDDGAGGYVEVNQVQSSEVLVSNRIYLKDLPSNRTGYTYVHLQTPENIPFIPDNECYVRILSANGIDPAIMKVEQVIDYRNGMMVVDDFNIGDWTNVTEPKMIVEVYKPKLNPSKVFFETGREGTVDENGNLNDFDINNAFGDTYRVTTIYSRTKFQLPKQPNQDQINYGQYEGAVGINSIESPTPCFDGSINKTNVNTAELKFRLVNARGSTYNFLGLKWQNPFYFGPTLEERVVGREIEITGGYTLDYSKISWGRGRPLLKLDNERETIQETTIYFTDNYIEESRINGLNRVRVANRYILPSERTPITKLQPAGNVLLAIHERSITSLYIGETFTKQNDQDVLITTDRVVGTDRLLATSIGTQNPESIAEYDGVVYGLDLAEAEVWRYANGIVRLSTTYKMKTYFKDKCKAIRANLGDPKIVGGFDPYRMEYLLTWPEFEDEEGVIWPAETIAFNERIKRWNTRYSFAPQCFGYIEEQMYMFSEGKIFKHHATNDYNEFFGKPYPSKIRFLANSDPKLDKTWDHLRIQSNNPWEMPEAKDENGGETYLVESHFKKNQDFFYSPILRNVNTVPEKLKTGEIALIHGDFMKGKYLEVELEFDKSKETIIEAVDVHYSYNSGQVAKT